MERQILIMQNEMKATEKKVNRNEDQTDNNQPAHISTLLLQGSNKRAKGKAQGRDGKEAEKKKLENGTQLNTTRGYIVSNGMRDFQVPDLIILIAKHGTQDLLSVLTQ